MPGVTVDGNDVSAVREAAETAVERARRGEGPTLIHCRTFRWLFHAMRDVPPPETRDPKMLEGWKTPSRDAIARFEDHMTKNGIVSADDVRAMRERVKRDLSTAVDFAESSPYPDPKDLLVDMFAE